MKMNKNMNQKTFLIIQQLKWELNASHLLLQNRCDFTNFICFISHILISVYVIYFLNIMIYQNGRKKNLRSFRIILGQHKYKTQKGVYLAEDYSPGLRSIKNEIVFAVYIQWLLLRSKFSRNFVKNITFDLWFPKL